VAATTGIARPKPRTGTGMVYRTSSKMRAPMILSGTSSVVSNASVSGAGGGGGGVLSHSDSVFRPYQSPILTYPLYFLSSVIIQNVH
jgi:hypothetical protein